MEDNQILDLYFQRNAEAIKETDSKYGAYCYAIANNILHNKEDSEECVNDTWFHAWNAIPPQRPTKFRLFLAKITRNLSFNLFQAQSAKKRGGGEIHLVLDELAECIAHESDTENECMAKPISMIANRYQMSTNNVMVILSRTRKKLKAYLEKEGLYE